MSDARQRAADTKRRRTRAAVIAAADRVFAARGWAATTVEAIAAEAEVGAATVYNHFPTKHALAAWTLRPHVEHLLDPDAYADLPPCAAVTAWVDELSARLREQRHLLAAFLQATAAAAEPVGSELAADDPRTVVPLVSALTAHVRRGQHDGTFPADPEGWDVAIAVVQVALFRVLFVHPEAVESTQHVVGELARRMLHEAGSP